MLKSRLRNLNFFNISIQLYFNTVYEPFPQHLHFNSEKTSYIILTYFLLSSTGVGFDKKYIRTWVELGKNMVCSYQGMRSGHPETGRIGFEFLNEIQK